MQPDDLFMDEEGLRTYLKLLKFFWKDGPLSEGECLQEYNRLWHPDRIEVLLGRVLESDREMVRLSAYDVAKILGRIIAASSDH
jgi:hypothetical protein